MGIESFDAAVIQANSLTCTPQVLMRAVAIINDAGAQVGPGGLPVLLPGLNLVYGLPGETHRTHYENLAGLVRILDAGYLCHRINVRQARAYPGTPLADAGQQLPPSAEHFPSWKADVSYVFDQPMKQRAYPAGRTITNMHSFFVTRRGTWHRRLGSYAIQVVEPGTARPLFENADMIVTGHEPPPRRPRWASFRPCVWSACTWRAPRPGSCCPVRSSLAPQAACSRWCPRSTRSSRRCIGAA